MKAVVTGCAGFIGSHLSEALLANGVTVTGVDAFTPYYDRATKHANVAALSADENFRLIEADLRSVAIEPLVDDADVVFHLAAQPGVRVSWADGFPTYVEHNILATQRLLEALRGSSVRRLVYASSSSVYGNAARFPTTEDDLPRPHSPYGVTKLAAEHLCGLYAENYGVGTVSLRYFTVYGPRQRPDMGFHRFLDAALSDCALPLYGDGEQVRDFTYVADVVAATIAASTADVAPGSVVNVAGGSAITVNALLELLGDLVGSPLRIEQLPPQPGDVRQTGGSIERAQSMLGWVPRVGLREGLAAELDWMRSREHH